MLFRCNHLAIARMNVFVSRRLFVSCTVCLSKFKRTATISGQRRWCRDLECVTGTQPRSYIHYTCVSQQTMTTTTTPPTPPPLPDEDKSQSIFQRFKNMAKKYWYIVLPVHLVTSTIWFGSFYFIASICDVPALLEKLGIPDSIIDKVRDGNSWTSYLVIAYGLYKIFTPLRYMVTLGGTGMTIRYLKRKGYVIGGETTYIKKP
ncbi:PREDICTED: protein FAM210A [Diuraphis noxia]|uniref:protein FAM210A n=1 Tax=Diuraphis noxia TaxID=143948 RepID=UPI0007635F7D|nr:PREDICTED: protein FAM210A [Diuraphis noxia]